MNNQHSQLDPLGKGSAIAKHTLRDPSEFLRLFSQYLSDNGIVSFHEPLGREVGDWPTATWVVDAKDGIGDFKFVLFYEPEKSKWYFTAQHSVFGFLKDLSVRNATSVMQAIQNTLNAEWREQLKKTRQYRKALQGKGKKYITANSLASLRPQLSAKEFYRLKSIYGRQDGNEIED